MKHITKRSEPTEFTEWKAMANEDWQPAHETDAAAWETITRLGLGHPKLDSLRMAAIEPFLDDSLTSSELEKFVTGYLEKDNDGHFGEFWTTIRYLFAGYASA